MVIKELSQHHLYFKFGNACAIADGDELGNEIPFPPIFWGLYPTKSIVGEGIDEKWVHQLIIFNK